MFSENQNVPFRPEQIRSVLGSTAGKKLLQLLAKDGGVALQQAAECLKTGDAAGAKRVLTPLMSTEEAAELVTQINAAQE